MSDRPIFDLNNPDAWPSDADGTPLSTEEVNAAIEELIRRGLVEVKFDERNSMWVRATRAGEAAYAIEEAFGFMDSDPFSESDEM